MQNNGVDKVLSYCRWFLLIFSSLMVFCTQTASGHQTGAGDRLGVLYSGEILGVPVHQYISREALNAWAEVPEEFKRNASRGIYDQLDKLCQAKFDPMDDVIIGSGEEDQAWN